LALHAIQKCAHEGHLNSQRKIQQCTSQGSDQSLSTVSPVNSPPNHYRAEPTEADGGGGGGQQHYEQSNLHPPRMQAVIASHHCPVVEIRPRSPTESTKAVQAIAKGDPIVSLLF